MLVGDKELAGTERSQEDNQHDAEEFYQVADNDLHDDFDEAAHSSEYTTELEWIDPGHSNEVGEHDHAPFVGLAARWDVFVVFHGVAEELGVLGPGIGNLVEDLAAPYEIHYHVGEASEDTHPVDVLPRVIKILLHNIPKTRITIFQHRDFMTAPDLLNFLRNEVDTPR